MITLKIINAMRDLFSRPVVVSACFHPGLTGIRHRNWGDDINYYFLKEMFGRSVSLYQYSSIANRMKKRNYLMIGSTIDQLVNRQSVIWGAGVIDRESVLPDKPERVLAVRGPLSREYLLEKGIDCPAIYGDPALLLPFFHKPSVKKKYRLGIIPHYQDLRDEKLARLRKTPGVKIISMEHYGNWREIPGDILECEKIASSSLHGLIMAFAYGIPYAWIEIGGGLMGGEFKFRDFFGSIGVEYEEPLRLSDSITIEKILRECRLEGYIDLGGLVRCSPFPIKGLVGRESIIIDNNGRDYEGDKI